MLHLLVAYVSTRSVLLGPCIGAINTLWYSILFPTRAKGIIFHQVLVSCFSLCNLIPWPSSNKTNESCSGLKETTSRPLVQCIGWYYRDHKTWEIVSREFYLWVMFVCKVKNKETLDLLMQERFEQCWLTCCLILFWAITKLSLRV